MSDDGASTPQQQSNSEEKPKEVAPNATSFDATRMMDMSKGAFQAALEVAQTASEHASVLFKYFQSYEEEETPLRGYFRQVREMLQVHVTEAQGKVEGQMGELVAKAQDLTPTVNFAWDDLQKVNEFRRKHPEVIVAGATTAVFVPSTILGSRWGMFSRTLKAGVFVSVLVYGANEIERRIAESSRK